LIRIEECKSAKGAGLRARDTALLVKNKYTGIKKQRLMGMRKILIVVGTRPNFIKVTQFKKQALISNVLDVRIVHTGQHYDSKMADVFFEQFSLIPDYFLNTPQGSSVAQIAHIMIGLEKTITDFKPDLVMVVGDVNSTFAAALTANKMGVRIAHLESGLRSFDKRMPEEHNRILTDAITDLYFVTEQSGFDSLLREGIAAEKIYFVGNTMIDTMLAFEKEIDASDVLSRLNLIPKTYALLTMHRPATVDSREGLEKLLKLITLITANRKLVFPVHPRTLKKLAEYGLDLAFAANPNLIITEPLDYFSFQKLIVSCKFILTDSGGIQEESTYRGIPCLTLRPNTERPVTVNLGTNELVPFDMDQIQGRIQAIDSGKYKSGSIPPLWDGKATKRILQILSTLR
jgi:UDP-N-acetylglucosamine 2-epimerase (non-hydrolysing)